MDNLRDTKGSYSSQTSISNFGPGRAESLGDMLQKTVSNLYTIKFQDIWINLV